MLKIDNWTSYRRCEFQFQRVHYINCLSCIDVVKLIFDFDLLLIPVELIFIHCIFILLLEAICSTFFGIDTIGFGARWVQKSEIVKCILKSTDNDISFLMAFSTLSAVMWFGKICGWNRSRCPKTRFFGGLTKKRRSFPAVSPNDVGALADWLWHFDTSA